MKFKNQQSKTKASANGVQKSHIAKKQKKGLPEIQVKEQVKAVAKKTKELKEVKSLPKNIKNQKAQKKSLPPKKIIEEEDGDEDEDDEELEQEEAEESSENGEDSGADVEAEGDDAEDDDEEEDEDEDSDDEELDEEANEEDESEDNEDQEEDELEENDNDSSDDEPAEEPIVKKSKEPKTPKLVGTPKIKSSDVPHDFPNDQVIIVTKLPARGQFKQADLVEVFSKYGTIHTIKPFYKSGAQSFAHIAFTSVEAAKAALAADKTNINGSIIQVSPRRANNTLKTDEEKKKYLEQKAEKRRQFDATADRSIFIQNLKPGTTEETLREHFDTFGEIEEVKVVSKKMTCFAFITYSEASSANSALKLHNSVLNNSTIRVLLNTNRESKYGSKDPKCTVILKNKQGLESCPGDKIAAIFSKCGEIKDIDIMCSRNVLAFISFKSEESVPKALALSGKTENNLELHVVEYEENSKESNRTVFMVNVRPGIMEEEIRSFFAQTGEIESVFIKMNFAIVKFANTDGFCKAFLRNEHKLAGRIVFLEPYSEEKKKVLKTKHGQGGKRKLPYNKNQTGWKRMKPSVNQE